MKTIWAGIAALLLAFGTLHAGTSAGQSKAEDVLVPLFLFLMIGAIVGLNLHFRFRRERLLHETIRAMVEKGAPIPQELLNPRPVKNGNSDLRKGVVLMAIGLGLALLVNLAASQPPLGLGVGAVPFLIGLGYFIIWILGRKNADSRQNGAH